MVMVKVADRSTLQETPRASKGAGSGVKVFVGVKVNEAVKVEDGVEVKVRVLVIVRVEEGVLLGRGVQVSVGVKVWEGVAVTVKVLEGNGVRLGVFVGAWQVTSALATPRPGCPGRWLTTSSTFFPGNGPKSRVCDSPACSWIEPVWLDFPSTNRLQVVGPVMSLPELVTVNSLRPSGRQTPFTETLDLSQVGVSVTVDEAVLVLLGVGVKVVVRLRVGVLVLDGV